MLVAGNHHLWFGSARSFRKPHLDNLSTPCIPREMNELRRHFVSRRLARHLPVSWVHEYIRYEIAISLVGTALPDAESTLHRQ